MANSNRNDGMNIERAVQQIMEEDDEEIYRENENSDSDVSDDDDDVLDPTYAPSILDAYHYDTEARIHSYYSTDSGSESGEEDENIFNDLPTASSHSSATSDSLSTMPAMNTRTGKDGSVWSSSSSPQGRTLFIQGYTEFLSREFTLPKMLFKSFSVMILLKKFCYVPTSKDDGLLRNGTL